MVWHKAHVAPTLPFRGDMPTTAPAITSFVVTAGSLRSFDD